MNLLAFLVLLIGVFLGVFFAVPVFLRRAESRKLARLASEKRALVLTYDDGPNSTLTPRVLQSLNAHQVRASFFVLGEYIAEHKETLNTLIADGHEVGSHTRHHSNAWRCLPHTYWIDLGRGVKDLNAVSGNHRFFRPPFGKSTILVWLQMSLNNLSPAFWTIDSQDSWDRRDIPDILDEVDRKGGGVVLMHDRVRPLRGPSPEKHPDYVINLTDALIDFAKKKDLRLMTFGELVGTS